MTTSGPSSSRARRSASADEGAEKVRKRIVQPSSDLAQSTDLSLGMDLVLRHDGGQGAEAFDDRPHIGAYPGTGQQDRVFAHQGEAFEGLADHLDELLQLGRRHHKLLFLAVA